MNSLANFLENLRPGGASNIPKSKLDQELTQDSDTDLPESNQAEGIKTSLDENKKSAENPQRPKRKIVKQVADVHTESSEFEDINMSDIPIVEENIVPVQISNPPAISNQRDVTSDENERIKKMWADLGIGKDGYLTLPELEKNCNYLEMNDMDKEDIQNLFLTFDTDKDNRISLTEFINGLKHQSQLKKASNEFDEKMKENRNPSIRSSALIAPPVNIQNMNPNHLFSTLDPNKIGFIKADKIVEFWTSDGILNGFEVLEYLNFKPNDNVNLVDLSVCLDREMLMADLDAITLSGLISYKKELQYCRSLIEIMHKVQSSKLYADNDQKLIYDLQNQIISLQELNQVALNSQKIQYEYTINDLTLNKMELMERIIKLNKEMSTMQSEYTQLKKRIVEVQELNIRQEEELDAVAELHRKMELELNLLRDAKLIFNQTMTQNDRDELYALKKKFEQQFERANNASMRKISEVNENKRNFGSMDGRNLMSTKTFNDLERKLQLKIDEVRYLRKELEDSRFNKLHNEKESGQTKYKELEICMESEKKRCENYKEENGKLRSKMQGLENKIDIAINREKVYRRKIEDTEKDDNKIKSFEEILIKTKKNFEENSKMNEIKLEKLSKTIDELKFENKEINKAYNILESEHEKIQEEIKNMNKDIIKKNRYIEDQKITISDLNDALRSSEEDVRLSKILSDKLELANDRLSKSLKNAANKISEFSLQNFDPDCKNIVNENLKVQKENILLEDEISQLSRRLAAEELSQSKKYIMENRNLQKKLKEKEIKIEEFEALLHKKNNDLRYDQYGSAKNMDKLQFKYEELNKKYQLQLEQVDKVDSLLTDLYKENSKLMKSLQRSETTKEQNDIKIIQLEEKINTLQNILNRTS